MSAYQAREPKPDAPKGQPRAPHTDNSQADHPDEARVRAALGCYQNRDLPYDDWLEVCAALNDWDPSAGWPIFLDWSRQSSKHDDAKARKSWDSLTPGGGKTMASIFKKAVANGWDPNTGPTLSWPAPANGTKDEAPLDVQPGPDPPNPKAYHGILGDITRSIEPHTEADPLALFAHAACMFGNVVGRDPHFVVEKTRHHLNEFMLTVGRSALGRKGTAKDWIASLFEPVDPGWAKDKVQKGLSSGEGLIMAVRDKQKGRNAIKKKGKVTAWLVFDSIQLQPIVV